MLNKKTIAEFFTKFTTGSRYDDPFPKFKQMLEAEPLLANSFGKALKGGSIDPAIYAACRYARDGDTRYIDLLLEYGADIGSRSCVGGGSVLHASHNKVKNIRHLLDIISSKGRNDILNFVNQDGLTAQELFAKYTASVNHPDLLQKLKPQGPDLKIAPIKVKEEYEPRQINGASNSYGYLLKWDDEDCPDPDPENNEDFKDPEYCLAVDLDRIINEFRSFSGPLPEEIIETLQKKVEEAKRLYIETDGRKDALNIQIDVECSESGTMVESTHPTSLQTAAIYNEWEFAKILLNGGASPFIVEGYGSKYVERNDYYSNSNTLHLAVKNRSVEFVKTIIDYYLEKGQLDKLFELFQSEDRNHNNVFYIAAYNDDVAMMKLLLQTAKEHLTKDQIEELMNSDINGLSVIEFAQRSGSNDVLEPVRELMDTVFLTKSAAFGGASRRRADMGPAALKDDYFDTPLQQKPSTSEDGKKEDAESPASPLGTVAVSSAKTAKEDKEKSGRGGGGSAM